MSLPCQFVSSSLPQIVSGKKSFSDEIEISNGKGVVYTGYPVNMTSILVTNNLSSGNVNWNISNPNVYFEASGLYCFNFVLKTAHVTNGTASYAVLQLKGPDNILFYNQRVDGAITAPQQLNINFVFFVPENKYNCTLSLSSYFNGGGALVNYKSLILYRLC